MPRPGGIRLITVDVVVVADVDGDGNVNLVPTVNDPAAMFRSPSPSRFTFQVDDHVHAHGLSNQGSDATRAP